MPIRNTLKSVLSEVFRWHNREYYHKNDWLSNFQFLPMYSVKNKINMKMQRHGCRKLFKVDRRLKRKEPWVAA